MKVKYLKFIPLEKFVELKLSSNEIVFVSILVSFSKDDKTLRAGYNNISEAMPCGPKTVYRIAESLRKKGLINIASGSKERNANTYYPTDKLKGLYRQNVPISIDKKSAHTPEGYVDKPGEVHRVPPEFNKDYQSDISNFSESYALKRLKQRIANKKN